MSFGNASQAAEILQKIAENVKFIAKYSQFSAKLKNSNLQRQAHLQQPPPNEKGRKTVAAIQNYKKIKPILARDSHSPPQMGKWESGLRKAAGIQSANTGSNELESLLIELKSELEGVSLRGKKCQRLSLKQWMICDKPENEK